MGRQFQILLQLYYQPAAAMGRVLDEGSLWFAAGADLAGNLLLSFSPNGLQPGVTGLLSMLLFFIPGCILFSGWIGGRGRFMQGLEQDYVPLLTCILMAEAAESLPLGILSWAVPGAVSGSIYPPAGIIFAVLFVVLAVVGVRVVFGLNYGQSIVVLLLAGIGQGVGYLAVSKLGFGLRFLGSPFLLYWLYRYYNNDIRSLGNMFQARQSFRRHLEASTINPRDADAQYQLGLIYQQRRQTTEAIARFEKAVAIDPTETDAQFQLGRIAREQSRFRDALAFFQNVLDQNEKHSRSEAWREIGAIHLAAKQYEHALPELERFVERRPYDPEGLYYLGQTMIQMGNIEGGKEMLQRCIEAARTAPGYRRGELRRWSSAAKKLL